MSEPNVYEQLAGMTIERDAALAQIDALSAAIRGQVADLAQATADMQHAWEAVRLALSGASGVRAPASECGCDQYNGDLRCDQHGPFPVSRTEQGEV